MSRFLVHCVQVHVMCAVDHVFGRPFIQRAQPPIFDHVYCGQTGGREGVYM